MNAQKNRNKDGKLITFPQASERYNIGRNTLDRLSIEAGAKRKIGKIARIDKEIMDAFLDTFVD